MPDRSYVDHLEADLRDLGRSLDLPDAPSTMAADVRARLEDEKRGGAPPSSRRGASVVRRLPSRGTCLAAAAAVLVIALSAGVALRDDEGPVGIRLGSTPPPEASAPIGDALRLGDPATLAEAAALLGDDLLLPDVPGVDLPDEVLIRRTASPPVVFLLWEPREGLPEAGDTGVGMLVTQVEGRTGCTFKQMVEDSPTAVETFADGWRGLWVEGRHAFRYCTVVSKDYREQPGRLGANALIWSEGSVSYRIEVDLTQAEAEAIAATMD